jgi:hypothetical protein
MMEVKGIKEVRIRIVSHFMDRREMEVQRQLQEVLMESMSSGSEKKE